MSGYGFRHAARMEWIKLTSVRSTWWLATAAVLSMAAAGVGVGLGYRGHTPVATTAQILNNSLSGAILAQLLLGALGVLAVTGEYGTGMIRSTFAAVPVAGPSWPRRPPSAVARRSSSACSPASPATWAGNSRSAAPPSRPPRWATRGSWARSCSPAATWRPPR